MIKIICASASQPTRNDQSSHQITKTGELSIYTPKIDLYAEITDNIVKLLEAGVKPWARPWRSGLATLPIRSTGEPYTAASQAQKAATYLMSLSQATS